MDWIEEYLEDLYAAARRLCGNSTEAEDLTHDTIMSALIQIQNGTTVENRKAWLYGIMKKKHMMNLRQKYRVTMISINGMDFAVSSNADAAIDAMGEREERAEESKKIRRAVAYLSELYRTIIVSYYFYGKNVETIAREMELPEGTVKSRLYNGREKLKKGLDFNMAINHYTDQSYQPKRVSISNSGMVHPPYRSIMNNLTTQNVLIAAYKKPLTAEEIALQLGIPTAYIEDALRQLVYHELVKQEGNRYSCTIPIFSVEDQVRFLDTQLAFVGGHYPKIAQILQKYRAALAKEDFFTRQGSRAQKKFDFYFVMLVLQEALFQSESPTEEENEHTQHANGTLWDAWGEVTEDGAVSEEVVEKLNHAKQYTVAGLRTSYANNCKFCEFDTCYDSFEFIPSAAQLLSMLARGMDISKDEELVSLVPKMIEGGYLTREDEEVKVDIPVIQASTDGGFDPILNGCIAELVEYLRPLMETYLKVNKLKVPAHLEVKKEWILKLPAKKNMLMMFVEKLVQDGLLFNDVDFPCPAKLLIQY